MKLQNALTLYFVLVGAFLAPQIGPPPPDPATEPLPVSDNTDDTPVGVDFIILNQYDREVEVRDRETGEIRYRTVVATYISFWDVHMMPPFGLYRIPVLQHRGWLSGSGDRIMNCSGGFAVMAGKRAVYSKRVIHLCTDYDFEYRNRVWFVPINP